MIKRQNAITGKMIKYNSHKRQNVIIGKILHFR